MGGLLKPAAAKMLFSTLCEEIGPPIHFSHPRHQRLAAVEAFDAAMDALSGNTSQPCLGSLEALRGGKRDAGLPPNGSGAFAPPSPTVFLLARLPYFLRRPGLIGSGGCAPGSGKRNSSAISH